MSAENPSKHLALNQDEVEVLLNTWLCMNTKPEVSTPHIL